MTKGPCTYLTQIHAASRGPFFMTSGSKSIPSRHVDSLGMPGILAIVFRMRALTVRICQLLCPLVGVAKVALGQMPGSKQPDMEVADP